MRTNSVLKRPLLTHRASPEILEAFHVETIAIKRNFKTFVNKILSKIFIDNLQLYDTQIVTKWVSLQKYALVHSNMAIQKQWVLFLFYGHFDVSFRDLFKYCLALVTGWTTEVSSFSCSLPEHNATSEAPHTGTVLYINQLPAYHHRNLASWSDWDEQRGGSTEQQKTTHKTVNTSSSM